ncbi:MAG: Gfo/Idh/MocA family oxidoreductase [Planctomycetia bacterium]|nr:Gfo/Idh/MocA family oxidoreductase [Planctomycetia bacterium]
MPAKHLNVALLGTKFMGKAHSHAWSSAAKFFDLPAEPVLKVAVGRDKPSLDEFAARWGWQETATDWKQVIARPDIDIVDIATPTALHCEMAIAAAEAGKHIFCEKPLALDVTQAERMAAAVNAAGVTSYLNHNYRRVPAVAYAKHLIDSGRLGRIFHWRGAYLQSWIIDPEFPLTWHLQAEHAGGGPLWDLGSHSVDLARFLVGEIASVQALTTTFIKERPLPGAEAGTFKAGAGRSTAAPRGPVTVEDAAILAVTFENGAIGSFESTRFATGRKNANRFEIYGEKGALAFDLERMNELEFFDATLPVAEQGFRTVLVTEAEHPYIAAWWPPGHVIGYEHTFTHAVADFIKAVAGGTPIQPTIPDGVGTMQVLEAAKRSAATGTTVTEVSGGGGWRA